MPDFAQEKNYWQTGHPLVAGLDEAGRGPWAGPVVAAAVVFPVEIHLTQLKGLQDSKRLSARQREKWFDIITNMAAMVGVGQASPREIDRVNILQATRLAMLRALVHLPTLPAALLIDAVQLRPDDLSLLSSGNTSHFDALLSNQHSFVRGESVSLSIAAASVIAKVTRDRQMARLDQTHPDFGFARHKGYGTKAHQAALEKFGPTTAHRQSFAPIKKLLSA